LVGAHGTGKTTLARRIVSEPNAVGQNLIISMTPEIPRIICSVVGDNEYLRRNKNTLLKQLLLLVGQPIYEGEHSREADVLVCDRSILDHWAYTKALFSKEIPPDIEHVLTDFLKKHLRSYDLLAYVPIEFAVQDDGIREGDSDFQANIDSIIHESLVHWAIPFIVIRGSADARSSALIHHIRELL
jgi:nicotinamide riboside kinase